MLLALFGAACTGNVGGNQTSGGGTGGEDEGSGRGGAVGSGRNGGGIMIDVEKPPIPEPAETFECKRDLLPVRNALRRLSYVEYVNSIKVLTRMFSDGAAVFASIADTIKSRVPEDAADPVTARPIVGANFRELDQNEGQTHVDGFLAVSQRFATLATATPARIIALAGACATDSNTGNDATCLSDFLKSFGTRVLRRPPSVTELLFFTTVVNDGGKTPGLPIEGLRDVVTVLLSSPDFLFQVETMGTLSGSSYTLSQSEKAVRLSYLFWQEPPDATLNAAAAAGKLDAPDGVEAESRRLMADPRFDAAWNRFSSQWLRLERLPHPEAQVGTKGYDLMRGDLMPTSALRDHAAQELTTLMAATAREGGIAELFTSRKSYVKDADLASIYGVTAWNGEGTPPQLPEERSGLLTRMGMVMTDALATRPIMKGVFVRRSILCDSLPDPPANLDRDEAPSLQAPYTVRQAVTALTETRSQCSACHAIINHIGFATENFDPLGRARAMERQIDPTGKLLGALPVDTRVTPAVFEGDTREVSDGVGLQKLLATSAKTPACLARQLTRYSLRAAEDDTADGCALEAIRNTLARGAPFGEAMVALARDPSFGAFRRAP